MAKNKVEIDVKVDDKGTTKKVALGAKQAADGLDKAAKSAGQADRNIKGTAQASANSTKNFSKMSQGMGGLVGAYATLAANVFAVTAAYQFLKRAGDLSALQASQEAYALKTGTSLKLLTSRIQEATGGILAFDDAAQSVSIGRAAGLSSDQLESLARIAKNASVTLGRDLTDSFNRLTRGAIKAEPELLDELGIIIRLDTAVKDYKAALNITGRELNTFEKTQAVVNAVVEQGVEKFDDIGEAVNSIAKFGKATDDLIKTIQKGLIGPATFIAEVFTKNIYALGAAASIMGVNLVKAIAPAAPELANLDEAAKNAKKSLQSIAGPSKIGQEIASGNFDERQIRAIENAQKSKTSKVINLSRMERNEIKRNLAIIKADHQRTMAANELGFRKYVANAKAQLYALQAEHGKVMGTLRAGIGGFASFASKAMNAIAILGVITLAISLAKELLELLKSDEIKKLEKKAEYITGVYKAQNEEVQRLQEGLKAANSPMERLVQNANLLSNFSYKGLSGFKFERLMAPDSTAISGKEFRSAGQGGNIHAADALKTRNQLLVGSLDEVFKTFDLQIGILASAGANVEGYSEKVVGLRKKIADLKKINTNTTEGTNAYNAALAEVESGVAQMSEAITESITPINAQNAAIQGITQTLSTFTELQQKFKKPSSNLTQLVDVYKGLKDQLQAITDLDKGQKLGDFFDDKKLSEIAKMTGLSKEQVGGLTRDQLVGGGYEGLLPEFTLRSKISELEEIELNQLTAKADIEKKYQEGIRSSMPFMQQRAEQAKQEAIIQRQIQDIVDERTQARISETELHPTILAQMNAEQDALEAQLETVKQKNSEIGQITDTLGKSLESGLGSALNNIVQGTMSVKDAFANMAMGILQALSQVITQLIAVRILQAIIGGLAPTAGSLGQVSAGGQAGGLYGTVNPLGGNAMNMTFGPTNRYGGVVANGKQMPGYAVGGIARGPDAGYPVTLHGTEAVVPLPNGKSIPVDMKGAGQNNNVVVNVSVDNQGNAQTSTESQSSADAGNLGSAIARAVQQELQNQKRSGGILNPYGVA